VVHPREAGPGTYALFPTSSSAILTGDFNMRPEDPTKQRISQPFANGVPALLDAWEVLNPAMLHPVSANLYDPTNGPPQCLDYAFVSEDLAPRLKRVVYDQDSKASDHQPILIELVS
jgi:endonuclease/exonuclease/phosphatase family metal-dependent hydrolase